MKTIKAPQSIGTPVSCKHCGHEWHTLLVGRFPLICPKCRSWFWNVEAAHVSVKELNRIAKFLKKSKK